MEEKFILLKPKIDVVFHALFKKGNEEITKAIIKATTKEKIEKISQDKELRRVAELREKAIRDERNGLRHAREEGIQQGAEQQKIEIAKEMKKQKYTNEEIQKITKLTKEEIENL